MNFSRNITSKNIKILFIIYFLIQLSYVFFSTPNFTSDSLYYYKLAQQSVSTNHFYPNGNNLYEDYIVAPIYINYLILILKIFHSSNSILFFNVILNTLNLLLIYLITLKIIGKKEALISILIYIFYLNNLGLILFNLTELLFVSSILLSLYFIIQNKNYNYLLSGLLIGISIGIRPLGWALLASAVFILIFTNEHFKIKKLALLIFGVIIIIFIQGTYSQINLGSFVFTSTTGSMNLIMGANDDANGGFNPDVFNKDKIGFIKKPETLTFNEKGKFWQKQALHWIKENPIKWLALIPKKIAHTFFIDDFALYPIVSREPLFIYQYLKSIFVENNFNSFIQKNKTEKIIYTFLFFIHHLIYFTLLIFFLFQFYYHIKIVKGKKEILVIELFIILSLLMTFITVGATRYKYPFLVMGFILISPIVNNLINKRQI